MSPPLSGAIFCLLTLPLYQCAIDSQGTIQLQLNCLLVQQHASLSYQTTCPTLGAKNVVKSPCLQPGIEHVVFRYIDTNQHGIRIVQRMLYFMSFCLYMSSLTLHYNYSLATCSEPAEPNLNCFCSGLKGFNMLYIVIRV